MKKEPNCGRIKQKKMGLYFHTINHAIQVFFEVSFLRSVDAPVICNYVSDKVAAENIQQQIEGQNVEDLSKAVGDIQLGKKLKM